MRTAPLFLLLTALLVGLASCAPGPSAPPAMPPIADAGGPVLPASPDQADHGSHVYWQICMACHGDQGQGLTDEWREAWGPEDMNCWQSKCHAANHPPQGFQLPRTVPPVVGSGALANIPNGQVLFTVVEESMPWWNPGSLTEAQAWEASAYLMKANRALPENVTLSALNAASIPLHPASPPSGEVRPYVLGLAGLLVLAALCLAIEARQEKDV